MTDLLRRAVLALTFLGSVAGAGCQSHKSSTTQPGTGASTEGMWLFDALPTERLRKQFNFAPSREWADHLRLSSVHVGASGSFVSADGLILTNHHVALGGLQRLSSPQHDYVANGFLARARAEEIRVPGWSVEVLQSIEDVTARVADAVRPGMSDADAFAARRAAIATIEGDAQRSTGLFCRVVTLYGGARYHLYRSKRYDDVRMVFAPEAAVAFFGGDPDNFEYPRYDLDVAFLRAYENGVPAKVAHWLRVNPAGVAEGDLVFVSGHPGRTDRLLPVEILRAMRDVSLPFELERLERLAVTAHSYAARNQEARRQAADEIFGLENSLKAMRPRLEVLRGPVMEQKTQAEAALREQLQSHEKLRHFTAAFDGVERTQQAFRRLHTRHKLLEEGRAFHGSLFWAARTLVRMATEDQKPDGQRIPEYTQTRRAELEQWLFADEPFYPELESALLGESLRFARDQLGAEDLTMWKMLGGQPPAARAAEMVRGSKLASAAERRRVRAAGAAAIAASTDPFIRLARDIDPECRELRRQFEVEVTEPQRQALANIAQARFALYGTDNYPDATGTLRLAYGVVRGYGEDGSHIPPWTTLGGAFAQEAAQGGTPPFQLPPSWARAKSRLRPDTPLNFVCTADIIGGNSGSPVVNQAGELVGIIFDSNRQGIVSEFGYDDAQARAVAVDMRAILETLRTVYGASELVGEFVGSR